MATKIVRTEFTSDSRNRPVVYFDGVCGLCNQSVNFLLEHDSKGEFLFAPLQGETACERLNRQQQERLGSVVFAANGRTWERSAAIVQILWRLGGMWKVAAAILWIIPRPLRDLGYMTIAKFRYRLFGKHESCRMPTPEEKDRFLP